MSKTLAPTLPAAHGSLPPEGAHAGLGRPGAGMAPLIALVHTAVLVDGERQVIAPGQPLPALDAPDQAALLATKAARMPTDTEAPAPAPPADGGEAPAPAARKAAIKR